LAGAAQLALVDLIEDDAPWIIAVGTALINNLRFALYSASLAPAFRDFPMRWRLGLAYLMTDQTAVTSLIEYEETTDPQWRRWFYLGAGIGFACVWWVGSTIGVLVGGDIPDGVQLGFAVPLTFLALLVPTLRDRPTVVAAAVGASVCVATLALPNSLNLIVGAVAGVAAGIMVTSR
jgi:predicted branched-subunit amino acid permease